jgi:PKD repeat protein
VIWAIPYWGYISYSEHQENMSAYLDAGGKLFISGQYVGQYIGRTDFFGNYLHASHIQYTADSLTLGGVPGDPIGDGLQLAISGGDGADNQTSPNEIAPLAPATAVLSYTTGSASDGAGAIKVDTGIYKAVYFSFGFEAINNANDRATVMARVLSWLLEPIPPVAAFTSSTPDWLGQETIFTNTTIVVGNVTYQWAFGDDMTSTLPNPTHAYTIPGNYSVALTATNLTDSDTATDTVTIYSAPTADFAAAPLTGPYPLTVTFTSTATTTPPGDPTLTYLWHFGDDATSPAPHPIHTYTTTGNYTVALRVSNAAGSDALTCTNLITVRVPVQANFTAWPTSGVAPLTVAFTNTSSGNYTATLWHFGDGLTSTLDSPTHTYAVGGMYTVALTVYEVVGTALASHTETKFAYITVHTPVQANFTAWPTSGVAPLTVAFTNTSSGNYTSTLWHFGDGLTSTLDSPTHTYTAGRTYTVALTVHEVVGTALAPHTETKFAYITVHEGHNVYLPLVMRSLSSQ